MCSFRGGTSQASICGVCVCLSSSASCLLPLDLTTQLKTFVPKQIIGSHRFDCTFISVSWYQTESSASPSSNLFEYQLQDWIVKDMGNDDFPQAIIVKIIKLMQMVLASFIMWSISKLEDLVVFRLYIVHTTVTWNICFNVSIRFPTS